MYQIKVDHENDTLTLWPTENGPALVYNRAAGTVTRGRRAPETVDVEEELELDRPDPELFIAMNWTRPTRRRRRFLSRVRQRFQRQGGHEGDLVDTGWRIEDQDPDADIPGPGRGSPV